MERDEELTYRASINAKLDEIIKQTTRTNGRVTALEVNFQTQTAGIEYWRGRIVGGLAVLSFIVGSVLIPLVTPIITQLFK